MANGTMGVSAPPARGWKAVQALGLAATLALLAGLWLAPGPSLRILWYAVIPVLPAAFLLHPGVWRNACPLATLNMLPGRYSRGLSLGPEAGRSAMVIGIGLLAVLVPARRFLLNTDGPALALVIVAVALLALASGFLFDRKAGFCNSICPVLPVERLYGQRPLARVSNARCSACSLCTSRGCLDLSAEKSVGRILHEQSGRPWILTSYGAFAAAFPGFVLAYYLIPDGTPADAAGVYLGMGTGAVASWVAVGAVALPFRLPSESALPILGALALGLYYWFGAPGIAEAWQLGEVMTVSIRAVAIFLLTLWVSNRLLEPHAPPARWKKTR